MRFLNWFFDRNEAWQYLLAVAALLIFIAVFATLGLVLTDSNGCSS